LSNPDYMNRDRMPHLNFLERSLHIHIVAFALAYTRWFGGAMQSESELS